MTGLNISRVRFLVVEDNPFMRGLLRQVLRALGVTLVAEATDGAEAFALMKEFTPDIVLLDWEMRPMDGIEFAKLVRTAEESPNRFVPLIMITAYSEIGRVTKARDAGVNEILAKPIAITNLFTRIRAVVERPRPYIEASAYFGPDRRRRSDPSRMKEERRTESARNVGYVETAA